MQHRLDPVVLNAAVVRFGRLARLTDMDRAALAKAASGTRLVAARRDVLMEGDAIGFATILLSGWACRVRDLNDGRRQIIDFILPGELIGNCHYDQPRALSTVLALTDITLCTAPEALPGSGLADAYSASAALNEATLFRQITRLGRLSALQRVADLVLELHERLSLSDHAQPNSFLLPLTQEVLADVLGLTSVHVNRTLKSLKSEGLVSIGSGRVTIHQPSALRSLATGSDHHRVEG